MTQHLILDLETIPALDLAAPLESDRLRELYAKLPPCWECHAPAEWKSDASDIWRAYCDEHRPIPVPGTCQAVGRSAPDICRQIDLARTELSKPTFGKPVEHRIVCIGYAWLENYRVVPGGMGILGLPPEPEQTAITKVAAATAHASPTVITFNGRCFDLPVLAARAFHHGIPFPWYWDDKPNKWAHARYRYAELKHLDVMDLLSGHGAAKNSSQDLWARAAGLPGKQGVDGSDVAGLHAAGKHQEIANYCLSDVLQLAGIFLRTELTRGHLSLPHYQDAAAALFETAGADERTRPLCAGIDLDRFLMKTVELALAKGRAIPSAHGQGSHASKVNPEVP